MSELVKVKPVNKRVVDGNAYEDRYIHEEVDVPDVEEFREEIENRNPSSGVEIEEVDGGVRYRYGEKVPVIVTEEGAFTDEVKAETDEARKQAYHVLSMLADAGYVSKWRSI